MYKSLFISLNIVGLLMVPLLYVGDVTIRQSGSSQVTAGEEIEITIDITKEGVAGPARLKLDLTNAQGIEIEDIETEGASFSFNGESALFIWYSIQPSDKVTIKYKIIADANASGSKSITGNFSYLDEDERKKKDIEPFNFTISGDGSAVSANTETTIDETEEEETQTAEAVTSPSTNNNEEETTTEEANNITPADVKCERTITQEGGNYIVSVSINKGLNGGFARLKESVPTGFTAEKVEAAGSIFKFADNSAKFLWSQIPKNKENIVVKYKLIPTGSVSGTYSIRGTFSAEFLIEDEKPKKIRIATSSLTVDEEAVVDNSTSNESKEEEVEISEPTPSIETKPEPSTTISSSSTNGVKYRVQIIAAHNTVSKRYIKKVFGYNGAVNIDNHKGWVKYTTNGYDSYKDAKNNRESLNRYDFDGPFVTAYNNGDRITVQEALMLSSQSWIQ